MKNHKTVKAKLTGVALLLGVTVGIGLALPAHAEQLLKNPDFAAGLTSWYWYVAPEATGPVAKATENHELRVVISGSNQAAQVQLMQILAVPLEPGKSYRLAFEAKGAGAGQPISVTYQQSKKPWASYGLYKPAQLKPDWSVHEYVFTATAPLPDNPGAVRLMLGNQTGAVHFRKFSLTETPGAAPAVESAKPAEKAK